MPADPPNASATAQILAPDGHARRGTEVQKFRTFSGKAELRRHFDHVRTLYSSVLMGISRSSVLVLLVVMSGCRADPDTRGPNGSAAHVPQTSPEWFVDRADESGLRFVHFNGMSGAFYPP